MKIIYKNLKKGELKLRVNDLDDLYYLSQIIELQDIVKGKTTRKIKLEKDKERKQAVIKKTVTLEISVEKVELNSSLRISGKITSAIEDIKKGAHHTIDVKESSIITIKKEKWLDFQLKRIDEASKESSSRILICAMDREEACFALLKKHGYDYLGELKGDVLKKEYPEKKEPTFYKEIIKKLEEYTERYKIKTIIIASPAFWKEYLLDEIKQPELKEKITLATCSVVGKGVINEILKRGELKTVLKEERTFKETNLVELLLKEIAKNKLGVYGLNETKRAVELGAVKILLVTDNLIQKLRNCNEYPTLEKIMKTTESVKGEVHIISTEHQAGKQLDNLGGIGAILRYEINYL